MVASRDWCHCEGRGGGRRAKKGGLSNEIGAKIVLAIAVLVRFSRH